MRHRAKRRDANHFEIVRHCEETGWSVLDTSQINRGLDLLVSAFGYTVRVEVKDGKKPPSARKLLESEQSVFDNWQGECVIWESIEDADATLKALAARRGITL